MKDKSGKKRISVIIPVYNAEKYIERCINSVVTQTYNNWEIIIIDDGSTDNTENIIRKKAKVDSRIHIYSQNNQGAGIARNSGIAKATGEYIVFLDADDYIDKDYFSLLMEQNEDVVFIDAKRIKEITGSIALEKMSKYNAKKKDDIIRYQMTGAMPWGAWRKAVKRSIIVENEIWFSNHKVGEEAIYSFCLMHFAKSFSFLIKEVYNYEVHENSLSQTIQEDPWGKVALALKGKITKMGLYEEYADTINSFVLAAGIVSLINMAKMYSWNKYRAIASERINGIMMNIDVNYKIDREHLAKKYIMMEPFIKFRILFVIYLAGRIYK